jgi:tetratricopeptide (TPR) repeat protein
MGEKPVSESLPPHSGKGRLMAIVLATIAGIALVAFLASFFSFSGRWGDGRETLPAAEECLRLAELKNISLAYLENEEFAQADRRLAEIAAKLPAESLGRRDLAIGRMLWMESATKSKPEPLLVRDAVEALARAEPDSPLAHLLLARWELRVDLNASLAESLERLTRAIAHYHQAAELAPQDPVPRFELYERTNISNSLRLSDGIPALGEAYRLTPENLWVVKEWLVAQAQAKDPAIQETIAAARERLRPVREQVLRRSTNDVWEFLDQAAAAALKGDWSEAEHQARRVSNVIYSDDVLQSDRRLVLPHLLELADYEFSPEFRKRITQTQSPVPSQAANPFPLAIADGALAKLTDISAIALADFDLNGTLDLIVLRNRELLVLGRCENIDPWSPIAKVEIPAGYSRLLVADLDEDESRDSVDRRFPSELQSPARLKLSAEKYAIADVDVVLYGTSGVLLLRNEREPTTGKRTLTPVEINSNLKSKTPVSAAVLVDFYHDGDLDLVLASEEGVRLWTNQGDMRLDDLSKYSSLPSPEVRLTSLTAVDWDRDADIDIVASGPGAGTLGWLENLRHGQFRWRLFESEYSDLDASRSLALLEADGNASWDLAGVGERGVKLALTSTISPGVVRHMRNQRLAGSPWQGIIVWDYDNDAHPDLLAWDFETLTLHRGGDRGEFDPAATTSLAAPKNLANCAVGDLDGDGDLDLVIAAASGVAIYDNQEGHQNHWLRIHLRGGQDPQQKSNGRVNHNGVGSLVEIKAGRSYQAQVSTGQTLHFGLGKNPRADVARVLWTNGLPQTVVGPRGDQTLQEVLILKGSCPYLYTWTGERYEFFTDLLWAAPLGLQFGEGKLAPSREWEYLKIPGDRLAQDNGSYRLQITEELWEAAYFDQVELIAVDHQADVEIYSNEKVGPAELAEFKVHTVRVPKTPVAARDKHDRNVLDQIKSRDGVYFRGFDGRRLQGLTDEHFLELDLGKLDRPHQIMLFLTGWIYPTDTSLNVAIGENPALRPPRLPYLLVPNEQGEWQEVRPYMGFPGGKTKTIAVDLSNLFPAEDYRLRIVTSAEIYWDEAFFTVDEQPAPTELTPLTLVAAELHERGFSGTFPQRADTPDTYDYSQVSREPRWPPMAGKFTRYGDVYSLLAEADDLHVVMGSGDEMTLEFAAASEPPPGWKRDFLLHNVGWDKDADLNTVFGQTVEPLPFAAMKSYPFPPGETYPDAPRHRRYLETFQTREQSPSSFWKQLQPSHGQSR